MYARLYGPFALMGLMTLMAAFFMGFRYDAAAPAVNYFYNLLLYGVFFAVHLVMMTPTCKRLLYGRPEGSLGERQIYIMVTVVTWLAVYALHWPVPGPGFESPEWLRFLGYCAMLIGVFGFFEFANYDALAQLLGMPGAELSHTVGAETPVMTEGAYASVRHPMYRAAIGTGLASLLVHPQAGQAFFGAMIGASFLGFIPLEEAQLIRSRGDAYREYQRATPWRVMRGVW
ncbi:hypothetical protein Mal64_11970 [Pseudobythopirellula maris]|uniref:Isoprenylcysteine carboxyl methyltransferase (ICMT) family protein n=1 Tax=Pseudobythopirellula maris TaxID=2527991 RepID=A0A5C5ZU91_9BACT|nr:hypothetical protein [Pseudobythopirellula maris]TWT90800.1 hypothetical protein Mal64_11970 [Pseudobythopirellula maris]